MRTAASVRRVRSMTPRLRQPTAPCQRPMFLIPARDSIPCPTVFPCFTPATTDGGYRKPGPCPRVTTSRRSTIAQYWTSLYSRSASFHNKPPPSSPPLGDPGPDRPGRGLALPLVRRPQGDDPRPPHPPGGVDVPRPDPP